jgi:hypothetical protein
MNNPRITKSPPPPTQAIIVGVDSVTMAIAQKLLCADWNVIYYDRSMNLLQVRYVAMAMRVMMLMIVVLCFTIFLIFYPCSLRL